MNKKVAGILTVMVFLLLWTPLLLTPSGKTDIYKPLDGNYEKAARPFLTGRSWLKGTFQLSMEQYFSDHLPGRDLLIRLYNSFRFECFKYVIADGVTVGKSDVLYQQIYIDALMGSDLVDQHSAHQDAERLRIIQDSLLMYNKLLVFIIAPGKASMYPEFLPDSVGYTGTEVNNYSRYTAALEKAGCKVLDLKKWLLAEKKILQYPVFPKGGTHWSGHIIPLMMDSMRKYIASNSSFQLPQFSVSDGDVTTTQFRFTDNDIGEKLNLLIEPSQWKLTYPVVRFSKPAARKPQLLSIGDSFNQSFWGFYPFFQQLFGDSTVFWYYNRMVGWPDSLQRRYIDVQSLDYYSEVMSRDIVFIVSTEQNLKSFSFNFVNQFYPYVHYGLQRFGDDRARVIRNIENDPTWLESIKTKSATSGIPLPRMVRMDAEWTLFNP